MAVPITMPRLGDVLMEEVVAKWARSSGDQIAQGDVIAEIETETLDYDWRLQTTVSSTSWPPRAPPSPWKTYWDTPSHRTVGAALGIRAREN